jgi:hypothetical protein
VSPASKIIKDNPEVQRVGIINGWRGSDYDTLAFDIIFHDGKRLMLSFVKSRNEIFILNRIGEYSFDVYFVEKTHGAYFGYTDNLSTVILTQEIGIPLKNINNIIKNYNEIYTYVNSLEERHKIEFQNCIYYISKTLWRDEQYHEAKPKFYDRS